MGPNLVMQWSEKPVPTVLNSFDLQIFVKQAAVPTSTELLFNSIFP